MSFLRPSEDIVYPVSDTPASLTKHETIEVSKTDIYTGAWVRPAPAEIGPVLTAFMRKTARAIFRRDI